MSVASGRGRPLLALVAALLLPASTVAAQDSARAAAAPRFVVSASPLFLMVGGIGGEAELALGGSASLGASGSYVSAGPLSYRSADLRVRVYRGGSVLRGVSLGASVGRFTLAADAGGWFDESARGSGTAAGLDLSYSWSRGADSRLMFSAGGGVKRVLTFAGTDVSWANLTVPTARVTIGYALK